MALGLFIAVVAAVSFAWGRINRIGYSQPITSMVRWIMGYSKMNAELIRAYLVWSIYLLVGLAASVTLLLGYRVNLLRWFALDSQSLIDIPLAFIAQSSLTGLLMAVLLVIRPTLNIASEVLSVPWIKYTLTMPRFMHVLTPLAAAVFEEVFFRGAVFLIFIERFPEAGAWWPILLCTATFTLQQVLQTDTFGQAMIMGIGSTAISIVGCIVTLYTHSFLPTLLCHAGYAVYYLRLGSHSKGVPNQPRAGSSPYAGF